MTTPAQSTSTASPCIRNCCLDDDNICLGCGRSLAEIVRWSNATESERQEILTRSRHRSEQRAAADARRENQRSR